MLFFVCTDDAGLLYKIFGNMFLITHMFLARLLQMNICFLTENFLTFSNLLLYVRDQITGMYHIQALL